MLTLLRICINASIQFILSGKPTFGTLIALLHNGVPIIGIINQPISKEQWIGVAGEQTTLNGMQPSMQMPSADTVLQELAKATRLCLSCALILFSFWKISWSGAALPASAVLSFGRVAAQHRQGHLLQTVRSSGVCLPVCHLAAPVHRWTAGGCLCASARPGAA